MNMQCARCGAPIGRQPGPGGRRRYCATCSPPRERRDRPRKRPLKPATPAQVSTIGDISPVTDVTSATVKELTDLGVPEDNWRHVLAVTLASRIDASDADTTAGLVACIKELSSLMAEIRAAHPPQEEPNLLEQLRQRRFQQGR